MMLSIMLTQATLLPIGPAASNDGESGNTPSDGMRAVLGFSPTMPQ
jgi:hypothetical protein